MVLIGSINCMFMDRANTCPFSLMLRDTVDLITPTNINA